MKHIFKKIYDFIPLKREVFLILKYFLNLKKNIYQHLHFKGIIKIKINSHTSFKMKHYGFQVENEIFWAGLTGGWEKISLKLWIELCKSSKVVVDVGANTGVYSLVAKSIYPKAQVYAFEPVKRVFEKLVANSMLNQYDIICCEKALSNFDGEATIYDTKTEHTYSVTVNKNLNDLVTDVVESKIEAVKLSSFIEKNNIPNIDLIKIDVETHEPEVLEGFGVYLKLFQPTMLIEILNNEVAEKIEKTLVNIPYLYFNIDENSGIRKVEKITKSDYYNYLICKKEVAQKLNLI